MKPTINSRKRKRNKLFRKLTNKTRNKRRNKTHKKNNRFHVGGLKSENGDDESSSRSSPSRSSPRSSPRKSSPSKELLKSPLPPPRPLNSFHSDRTYNKQPKRFSTPRDSELFSAVSSISHEQAQNPPPKPPTAPVPVLDVNEVVKSYNLSQNATPQSSEFNPPKSNIVKTSAFYTHTQKTTNNVIHLPFLELVKQPGPPTPTPLTVKIGSSDSLLSQEERGLILQLSHYHDVYWVISPELYLIMASLNLEKLFGNAIVWGDLNDDLIECIGLSSVRAIESRLLYKDRNHIRLFIDACKSHYTNLGESVSGIRRQKHYKYDNETPNISVNSPSPTNLQIIGYNSHPFFNPPPITHNMYKEGMNNRAKLQNEYVFIQAHGGMGNELSNDKKLLAKKYLRVLEFGSVFEVVGARYRPLFKKINELMLRSDYNLLFHNTKYGKDMRKKVYSELCKYFDIGITNACQIKDGLTLVDLTHDRNFQGHFQDSETVENHKITFKSIEKFKSMGMFVPVDPNLDTSEKFLYKKELFKLYPGSMFFTKSAQIQLVDTLLPIAISQNKIFNILVFSCAVSHDMDPVTPPYIRQPPPVNVPGIPQHPIQKYARTPGKSPYKERNLPPKREHSTPHFDILLKGKKYISNLMRHVIFLYRRVFNESTLPIVKMYDMYDDTLTRMKPVISMTLEEIDEMVKFLKKLWPIYLSIQSLLNNASLDMTLGIFSFNNIGENARPYYLIDDQQNPNINSKDNDDLAMVKIYLIKEFYDKCYKKVLFLWRYVNKVNIVLGDLKNELTNPDDIAGFDNVYPLLNQINDYIEKVNAQLSFCNIGLQKTSGAASFYNYPKFVELVNEYKKKRMSKFYDQLFPNMNYDQYMFKMKDLPTGWIEQWSNNDSRAYYVDTINGVSYWNRPLIPPDWKEQLDSNGKPFYVNDITGQQSVILPGIGSYYPDENYFGNETIIANPSRGDRKQRQSMYKYDELDNIDKVKARIKTYKRKTDIGADLLSSARRRERTVKNTKILDIEKRANLKKNPLIRDRLLEEADKIRNKVRNDTYHISA